MKKFKPCIGDSCYTQESNPVGSHDYTEEIERCLDFMFQKIREGRKVKTVMTMAIGSYGFAIAENARRAIQRNLIKQQ